MKSSYYLAVHTDKTYTQEDYDEVANTMGEYVVTVLEDYTSYTKGEEIESAHAEVEILMEEGKLACKAVLDFVAPGKVQLDKTKVTTALRKHPLNLWGAVKVEKRVVPNTSLAEHAHTTLA